MKIKEVEECVGLSRSNIRFYEREGLLSPDRNENNNYRDYTDEDVKRIKKIKILRMLGVSTADIRRLYAKELELEEVMSGCMKKLEEEERELREMRKICETIISQDIDIHSWDGEVPQSEKRIWKERLEEIFSQDTVSDPISRSQFNQSIAKMLSLGYFLSAVVTVFIWPFFENYQGFTGNGIEPMYQYNLSEISGEFYTYSVQHRNVVFLLMTCGILSAYVCTIGAYLTENMKKQMLVFLANGALMAPILIGLVKIYEDTAIIIERMDVLKRNTFSMLHLCLFWIFLIAYVAVLYVLSEKWEKMFTKLGYTLAIAAIFTILYAGIFYLLCGKWLVTGMAFAVMLFYIGLNWTRVNMDKSKYNKFDAVVTPRRIMNPLGMFLHM